MIRKAPGLTATLWVINLASISASVLVYIYLSHYAYREFGSLLVSEFVLFAPMVMPVLLVFQLNQVASRLQAKLLLLLANVIGALVCAMLFFGFALTPWSILIGAGIVGTLDAVQRVARIVAIKRYFSAHEVRFTVPLTLTAQFIAGAIAGAIMAFLPGKISTFTTATWAISLMGLAAVCALLLPQTPQNDQPAIGGRSSLSSCLSLVRNHPSLRDSLATFVILGAFFQGFYNISRVALPAHHLGLGNMHVGLLQIVASMSAVVGALVFYALSRRKFVVNLSWIYGACAGGMVLSCVVPGVTASFVCYFIFFFFFEIAFFRLQGDILAATPVGDMPLVASLQYALVYAGMLLSIAIGAVLIDQIGMTATAVVFALGFYGALGLFRQYGSGHFPPAPTTP